MCHWPKARSHPSVPSSLYSSTSLPFVPRHLSPHLHLASSLTPAALSSPISPPCGCVFFFFSFGSDTVAAEGRTEPRKPPSLWPVSFFNLRGKRARQEHCCEKAAARPSRVNVSSSRTRTRAVMPGNLKIEHVALIWTGLCLFLYLFSIILNNFLHPAALTCRQTDTHTHTSVCITTVHWEHKKC